MVITITPEVVLYLSLFINNVVGMALKNLEGKTLEEIREMTAAEQEKQKLGMAEMHSTD
jgi:hypothetical protein